MKTSAHWRRHFERNRLNRFAFPTNYRADVEPALRQPLVRSLQRFQVGESGGSGCLQRAAQTTEDEDYIAAIRLFVAEEGEHGRLLAQMLGALNAPLLDGHWSDRIFVMLRRIGGRRLSGLQIELCTLLVAEMIALRYYRALHDLTDDSGLQAMCAQILRDEKSHVHFHCDFLRSAWSDKTPGARVAIEFLWRLLFFAACALVWFDHKSVLQPARLSALTWLCDCAATFKTTATRAGLRSSVVVEYAA